MGTAMSRRQFLAAGAGLAAVTYLGGVPGAFGRSTAGGHPTVQPHLLGVQHFSVRDATARLGVASSARLGLAPTMGRLGGPDYPATRPTWARWWRFRAATPRCSSTSPRSASRASSSSSRRRTSTSWAGSQLRPRSGRISTTPASGAGHAPVRPRQPRREDRQPDRRRSGRLPDGARREPVRLPPHPRHEDDGLLGQPLESEHARQLGQPDDRRDHVRVRRPRGARRPDRRDPEDRGVQYFFHPEQDNYRFFDDPATPSSTPCTGSSG